MGGALAYSVGREPWRILRFTAKPAETRTKVRLLQKELLAFVFDAGIRGNPTVARAAAASGWKQLLQ